MRHWVSCLGACCVLASLTTPTVPSAAQPAAAPAQPQPATLSDRQIRQILTDLLAAAQKRDSALIATYLAPTAQVTMIVSTSTGEQRLSLNRAEYEQYLQQGFAVIQDYTSTLSDVNILVAPDQKSAIVTYKLTETTTIANYPYAITAVTQARARFEPINQKIVATQIDSRSTLTRTATPPAPK